MQLKQRDKYPLKRDQYTKKQRDEYIEKKEVT